MKFETVLSKAPVADVGVKTKVCTITREFAAAVLEHFNGSNRPLSLSLAKLYANEFLRCEWRTNGEPIIFSKSANGDYSLISGQHRLKALLIACDRTENEDWPHAQTEFDAVIVYGTEPDTADSVDLGKNRSHSDVLFRDAWVDRVIPEEWASSIAKRKTWTKTLAGAARLVWLASGGATVSAAPKFLISEMLTFLQDQHEELTKFVTSVLDANDADGGNKGLKMSLPYLAALSYVASLTPEGSVDSDVADRIDAFLNSVACGVGFEKGEPAWALTAYWNALTSQPGSKDRDREWVGPFIKAVKALLADETGLKVSDIKLSKKESDHYSEFPLLFDGWHTAQFEHAAAIKAAVAEPVEQPAEEPVADEPVEDVVIEDAPTPVKAKRPKPSKRKTATATA